MREYGFSQTRILSYMDRKVDSVLIRQNMGQWKPVFLHILCSVWAVEFRPLFKQMNLCRHDFHNGVMVKLVAVTSTELLWCGEFLCKQYFDVWISNLMMNFYLTACLTFLINLDMVSQTLKEYLDWLKMHFSAGLQSFYKPCSKAKTQFSLEIVSTIISLNLLQCSYWPVKKDTWSKGLMVSVATPGFCS